MSSIFSNLGRRLLQLEEEVLAKLNPKLPKGVILGAITDAKSILEHPKEEDLFRELVDAVENASLQDFDPGILSQELLDLGIYEQVDAAQPGPDGSKYAEGNIMDGTFSGTQLALTQIYARLERSYGSYFDVLGLEPTLPRIIPLPEKREMYRYSAYPADANGAPATYPPHLEHIPSQDDVPRWQIFNALGLAESAVILLKVVPDNFLGKTADWILEKVRGAVLGNPDEGLTISDVEEYNRYYRKSGTDIARGENIGLLSDWHSDRRFADQSFTGTNPTTITQAPEHLINEFIEAAEANQYAKWVSILKDTDRKSLFVQDCSYFRKAIGVTADSPLFHQEPGADDNWACAAVTLFQLHDNGKLHPIAITIDYKESMAKSVTIFNKRMSPSDSTADEKTDWAWRYAKTCAQVSDWAVHELAVHLTNAHFIEEAVIVATNRTIPMDHVVFKILYPHWYKTLSLNAAARDTLVPQVIKDIVGFSPEQTSSFVKHAYESFDFVGNYVPNQLRSRGFPSDGSGLEHDRYKNYAYAKNMSLMWSVIHKYVRAVLQIHYNGKENMDVDRMVSEDPYISDWCIEVQTAAKIKTFPTIRTFDELVDAVTMCIHIASPFHSTVNYLQNFYQAFVVAKPSCLCSPPPAALAQLQAYTEKDLVKALPLDRQREWLLASQIPWLLSFRVASDRSLLNFALSQWNVYKRKTEPNEVRVRGISKTFYEDLVRLARIFFRNSKAMDEGSIPYMVMDPGVTAVSILI